MSVFVGVHSSFEAAIMDGLNACRTARVAEILADFRTLQLYIASAPDEPRDADDSRTAGWTALRQSVVDGHHILESLRWLENRDLLLQGRRPYPAIQPQLHACDLQLQAELAAISDEYVYAQLDASDQSRGRWTVEDPSLRSVQRWLRIRQR
ncbi:hypothetical protein CP532_4274 [Ophiocordyceps camponoti-leonardi (nom. inval.)]|nr:hypothetical protein CP532_4274 [Ophiocordyceps camponoti-leonardi (nom. inval.)]